MRRRRGGRLFAGVVAALCGLPDEVPLAKGVGGELARVAGLASVDGLCVACASHIGEL